MKRNSAAFPILALTLGVFAVPALAQSNAGTMNSNGSPQNAPIPQTLNLTPLKNGNGLITLRRKHYPVGAPVAIDFTIQNTAQKPIIYNYPTAQQFDVIVKNAQGKTVWDWAQGQTFAPHLASLPLKPGEKKTYHVTWDGRDSHGQPVMPGVYTIKARMTSSNHPAITGNLIVNTDTDPQNIGIPTRTPAENGVMREVFPNPPITASKTLMIGAAKAK